jgi:hypothetical protein
MRPIRFLVLLSVLAASGCFVYLPSSPQEVSLGEGVRLHLTADEAAKYVDLRLASPRVMDGTVVDRTADELVVDTPVSASDRTRGTQTLVQRVSVPLTGIVDVEEKKLDTFRTSLLTGGGITVAALALFHHAIGIGGSKPEPTEEPEARRIPLIRFAIPLGGR